MGREWLSTIKIRHCQVPFEWDAEKPLGIASVAHAQDGAALLQAERAQPHSASSGRAEVAIPRRNYEGIAIGDLFAARSDLQERAASNPRGRPGLWSVLLVDRQVDR